VPEYGITTEEHDVHTVENTIQITPNIVELTTENLSNEDISSFEDMMKNDRKSMLKVPESHGMIQPQLKHSRYSWIIKEPT
jgi:predicted nuclease of predicted toxin-antitoxin system